MLFQELVVILIKQIKQMFTYIDVLSLAGWQTFVGVMNI